MEAVLYHVPAICFSQRRGGCDQILREHLSSILMELAQNMPGRGEAWNVNFPNCFPQQFRGILYDRRPAQTPFFDDVYYRQERGDGGHDILLRAEEITGAEEGSDIQALIDGYISVGVIRNQVME
jgi:5'-nucleotidase